MNILSQKCVEEYQKIYKKEYGEDIAYEKALTEGTKLLNLFGMIYQPIPKRWLVKQEKRNNKNERR